MNKAELDRKIKELGGLSKEDKSALLELLHSQKKYGLVWEGKTDEAEQKMLNHLPVLKEVVDRAIISDNPDARDFPTVMNEIRSCLLPIWNRRRK